ncbi:hypothetical protein QE152_g37685 [Popillia japonica]|uniref:Uncharacterized protein n=1 Tax=Popillia japonica TaxID=7064 RepID=A0AAW1I9T9_POPJA
MLGESYKNISKKQGVYKRREEDVQNNLDNLFDIAHANATEWMKIEEDLPETVTVYWDGTLLPGLGVRSSKEERLPILISFGEKEQLLTVPKLDSSSGQKEAKAVLNTLYD